MIVATTVLAGLGLVAGLGLAMAAKFFAVETDPRQDEINDVLPGANCGGCGFAGCNDFAKGVVEGRVPPDGCPVGGSNVACLVAHIMGLTVEEKVRQVALVMCQGDDNVAGRKYRYNGMTSCTSAALLGGGDKQCSYGCLGLADCQVVCAFGAIEMTEGGIARVIPERCTSCNMCVEICPKDLIELVPETAPIHVLCKSRDKGGVVRKACTVGCIGCKKCEKFLAESGGGMVVTDALSHVDYTIAPTDTGVIAECPTNSIVELHLDGKGETVN